MQARAILETKLRREPAFTGRGTKLNVDSWVPNKKQRVNIVYSRDGIEQHIWRSALPSSRRIRLQFWLATTSARTVTSAADVDLSAHVPDVAKRG